MDPGICNDIPQPQISIIINIMSMMINVYERILSTKTLLTFANILSSS